jgi:1-deoxyxylulose-5-phosphate synthase
MAHAELGRTGVYVSRLCVGTMTFGYQTDEQVAHAILDAAADAGVTMIDTADGYPLGGSIETVGRTEEILGRWLQGRRDDYFVATKCNAPMGRRRFQRGLSRRHVFDAVDGSLRRLGTDYLDLLQLHSYDTFTPLDETLGALDDLVHLGKVRYVGCSNFRAYQIARGLGLSDARGWIRFVSAQHRYNLLYRQIEPEVLRLCEEDRLGVLAYSPVGGGFLTGKHRPGAPTEGTRFTLGSAADLFQRRYWDDTKFETVAALGALAREAGLPLATLAVAWVLAQPVVTSVILGASAPSQLTESLAALDVVLDADLAARLDQITRRHRYEPEDG